MLLPRNAIAVGTVSGCHRCPFSAIEFLLEANEESPSSFCLSESTSVDRGLTSPGVSDPPALPHDRRERTAEGADACYAAVNTNFTHPTMIDFVDFVRSGEGGY